MLDNGGLVEGRDVERKQRRPPLFCPHQLIELHQIKRLIDPEWPHPKTNQARQVRGGAQESTEAARDRSNVGPCPTLDAQGKNWRLPSYDLDRIDPNSSGRGLSANPGPSCLVSSPPANMNRRDRRRPLVDRAQKGPQRLSHFHSVEPWSVGGGYDSALGIIRIRRGSERHIGPVDLGIPDRAGARAGCPAEGNWQHANRCWIEGPRVSYSRLSGQ